MAYFVASRHIQKEKDSIPVVTCDEAFFPSQKERKSADGKGDETFLLASHTKREEGKRDCRLFLLTCVAQKRLCSFGIVCLVHVFANVTVHNVQ